MPYSSMCLRFKHLFMFKQLLFLFTCLEIFSLAVLWSCVLSLPDDKQFFLFDEFGPWTLYNVSFIAYDFDAENDIF